MSIFRGIARPVVGRRVRLSLICVALVVSVGASPFAVAQVAVTTYHYDNFRTGWNKHETTLTYGAVSTGVAGKKFGLLYSIPVDSRIDGQPLVIPNAVIDADPNQGTHDVVFVVTENNSVYAIDPTRGTILNKRTFSAPDPWPLNCHNNTSTVGINSTPIIDTSTNSLYMIDYTQYGPYFYIHRLALHDFSDVVPAQRISASHTLTDHSTFTFNGLNQRQRAALLEQNGAVYAGFASFCDYAPDVSRGWLLGWRADTLAPLPINNQPGVVLEELTNQLATSPNTFFLSSIWMSGFGLAADGGGNLYFATGNSDYSGTTYNGQTNIEESVVKFSPTLNKVLSLFTPWDISYLDANDLDFGAGGVMLLPVSVSGLPPRLAVAAGKLGKMFLLNRDSLGGFTPGGPNNVVATVNIGGCWCGPSFFWDGSARVVSSGGSRVMVWGVQPPGGLALVGSSAVAAGVQDPGFFTTVSSSGVNHPIIWAVSRPSAQGVVTLYAFQAEPSSGSTSLPLLFSAPAGAWPNTSEGNANIMPVVANGRVYVASDGQLDVFGLGATGAVAPLPAIQPAPVASSPNNVSGPITSVNGATLMIQTRAGTLAQVNVSAALAAHEVTLPLAAGRTVTAYGTRNGGVLYAVAVGRAKDGPAGWPPDR